MRNMKILLSLAAFTLMACPHAYTQAQSSNAFVSLEHLNNGLMYCISESKAPKNSVVVKLAVRFDDRWHTERERKVATLLERLICSFLEDKQAELEANKEINVAQLQMHEPELFAVPNITLYKWEIAHPTQEQIDSTFSYLSQALEVMATIDENLIEKKVNEVLEIHHKSPFEKKIRQPFYEDDEQYPAASLEGIEEILPAITATELKAFYVENYKPQNMVLFVTGNVAHLAISNSIRSYFSFFIAADQANNTSLKDRKGSFISNIPPVKRNFEFDLDTSYRIEPLVHRNSFAPAFKKCSDAMEEPLEPKSFERLEMTEKEEKAIYKIIHTLGTSNVPKLLWKKRELEKLGSSINHVHPMKFIATILTNPTLRADLQEVRRSFFKWNGFIDGFRRRMTEEYYKNNIQHYVLGFCEELDVKEEVVEHFVERRDWEGLVKAILY